MKQYRTAFEAMEQPKAQVVMYVKVKTKPHTTMRFGKTAKDKKRKEKRKKNAQQKFL